jgi:hypothetical protein
MKTQLAECSNALALEAIRSESMERPDAAKLVGMGRLQFGDFLQANGLPATTYGVEDLLEDIETGDRLRATGLLSVRPR